MSACPTVGFGQVSPWTIEDDSMCHQQAEDMVEWTDLVPTCITNRPRTRKWLQREGRPWGHVTEQTRMVFCVAQR